MILSPRIRKAIFGISPDEARVDRRGFVCEDAASRERLERVGREFIGGYLAALEAADGAALSARLESRVEIPYRGFAYEGAGMGVALLDGVRLTRGALARFVANEGQPHVYMIYVGAGWAIARLPWLRRDVDRAIRDYDPLLRWLAVDGYGFHEGYFHWQQSIRARQIPRGVSGYARRAFDHGLGRSLWFFEATDPQRVAATICKFPEERHSDLWSGVGLAATYAGAEENSLRSLRTIAGHHLASVAQGAAFAAETRRLAGNIAPHCKTACEYLCGMTVEKAAAIAMEECEQLPPDGPVPAYEAWRQRIQQRLAQTVGIRIHA